MKIDRASDIAYAGKDPRDVPAYSSAEGARYLGLAASTLRRWITSGRLSAVADRERRLLSFRNLVAAHDLAACRQSDPARRLDLIARNSSGVPGALYPVSTGWRGNSRLVVIDPSRGLGQPTIAGTGIRTAVVAGRRRAGESLRRIAEDYARPVAEIRAAVRFEMRAPQRPVD